MFKKFLQSDGQILGTVTVLELVSQKIKLLSHSTFVRGDGFALEAVLRFKRVTEEQSRDAGRSSH